MPFRSGLFAPSRRPQREANRPRTLWKGSTPALDLSPYAVCRRGSRAAIVSRGSSCRQPSAVFHKQPRSQLTHFRSTNVIHFRSIDFSDGCFQSDQTSLPRYFRLPEWLWGSGVRSAHAKSQTSAFENRQSVEFLAPCQLPSTL